jgi:deoxyribonuclease V
LKLIQHVRKKHRLAPVVLVDGTGILHPRHAGIASHLGILADVPTVGVTKKLLCGQVRLGGMAVGETRSVLLEDQPWGIALKSKANAKPIYISPGHGVDIEFTRTLVRRLLQGHKLPEPLYWADRLSREATRRNGTEGPRLL